MAVLFAELNEDTSFLGLHRIRIIVKETSQHTNWYEAYVFIGGPTLASFRFVAPPLLRQSAARQAENPQEASHSNQATGLLHARCCQVEGLCLRKQQVLFQEFASNVPSACRNLRQRRTCTLNDALITAMLTIRHKTHEMY